MEEDENDDDGEEIMKAPEKRTPPLSRIRKS
jgi:hypothetical protein